MLQIHYVHVVQIHYVSTPVIRYNMSYEKYTYIFIYKIYLMLKIRYVTGDSWILYTNV